MKTKIAVILVTYNRLEKLKIALKCYDNQIKAIEEMIIVDNCSNDGTKEFLENWCREEGKYKKSVLHLAENTGGAGGFGAGMDLALERINAKKLDAEWLLVSDDDAFPEVDALEKLCEYYEKLSDAEKKNVAALSSTVINHGKIHEAHRSRIEKKCFSVKFVGVDSSEYRKEAFDIDLFSYVGTMIKVSSLKKVGTTNKDLFIYGDDNEHSFRIKRTGKLICVSNSKFIHDTPGVENRAIGWHNYYNRRNQLYILKQYFPKRYLFMRLIKRYILDVSFISKNSKDERNLFRNAHKDALSNRLGKHVLYKPGFHF